MGAGREYRVTDTPIVIIGAGLAGLGAAALCRDYGKRAVVLEASGRTGGRAWTDHPPALGGVWFDMGAVWFHDAEHNPLVTLARDAGDTLLRSDEIRQERTFIGDRLATEAELNAYAQAWPRYEAAADAALAEAATNAACAEAATNAACAEAATNAACADAATNAACADNGDVPLSDIARRLPGDPWAATIEAWEGPVICAVDAPRFSALDWRRNALGGSNLVPEGGIGTFVQRRLTQGLDIRLHTPVTRIRWGGPGGSVTVETASGSITADACITTVSTGVLGSGALQFDPPLPVRVTEAIHALPMGLAMKVALRATGPDRLDLPLHCSVDRILERQGEALMPFQCWPFGRDYVQGWIGGSVAWDLARQGEAAAVDFALGYLRRAFGGRVDRLFAGGTTLVTHWDADPWIRGAYCYAVPGSAMARDTLGEPVSDGHLMFAGEACHVGFAGTLAGAWISGQAAARTALAAIGG
jgi:monoamine oxidase